MSIFVGVDGGGSSLRVVVTTAAYTVLAEAFGSTANPNLIGRDAAKQAVQAAVHQALTLAGLTPLDVTAVGLGIAGADSRHSEAWVRDVAAAVLPRAAVAASSDHEIALVGAHGARRGLLVLSGTGSLASGVGVEGRYVVVGARGYLLGDEGSGCWIGSEGLRAALRAADGRGQPTTLTQACLNHFALPDMEAVIPWLYHAGVSRIKDIAAFAAHVIQQAGQGDAAASDIVLRAAQELALSLRAVRRLLGMEVLPIAFAGGLLTSTNPLSLKLCQLLGLSALPQPMYPPVIGAAILAASMERRAE